MKPFLKSVFISSVLLTSPLLIQTPSASAFELPGQPTTLLTLSGDVDATAPMTTSHTCDVYAPTKEIIDIDVTPAMGSLTLTFTWEAALTSWSYDSITVQGASATLTPNATQKYEITDPAHGMPQSHLFIHNPSASGAQILRLDFARLKEVASPAAVRSTPKLEDNHIASSQLVTIFGKDGNIWGRAADGREVQLGAQTPIDIISEGVKASQNSTLTRKNDPLTGKTTTTASITE